ncbi:MAG TPA: hypothetical protein VFZ61_16630, partial [Polyangiales bacterium]
MLAPIQIVEDALTAVGGPIFRHLIGRGRVVDVGGGVRDGRDWKASQRGAQRESPVGDDGREGAGAGWLVDG